MPERFFDLEFILEVIFWGRILFGLIGTYLVFKGILRIIKQLRIDGETVVGEEKAKNYEYQIGVGRFFEGFSFLFLALGVSVLAFFPLLFVGRSMGLIYGQKITYKNKFSPFNIKKDDVIFETPTPELIANRKKRIFRNLVASILFGIGIFFLGYLISPTIQDSTFNEAISWLAIILLCFTPMAFGTMLKGIQRMHRRGNF
ncbi:MAG: hypothetical protein OEV06_05785 [Anaerolineae bacterium]|nr:hypothetical protein [Anaerolineae bacterium]